MQSSSCHNTEGKASRDTLDICSVKAVKLCLVPSEMQTSCFAFTQEFKMAISKIPVM